MFEFAVFDLDGCISDDRWRRDKRPLFPEGAIEKGIDPFDAYNCLCGKDDPGNLEVVSRHVALAHCIVFITARPARYRAHTRAWLNKHVPEWHALLMRPDDDFRASPQLKKELLLELMANRPRLKPVVAYDDRDDVVAMYNSIGIDAQILEI